MWISDTSGQGHGDKTVIRVVITPMITAPAPAAEIRAVKSALIKGVVEYLQRYMLNNPLVLTYINIGLY